VFARNVFHAPRADGNSAQACDGSERSPAARSRHAAAHARASASIASRFSPLALNPFTLAHFAALLPSRTFAVAAPCIA
jgi:hypothetical protein